MWPAVRNFSPYHSEAAVLLCRGCLSEDTRISFYSIPINLLSENAFRKLNLAFNASVAKWPLAVSAQALKPAQPDI